MDIGHKIKQLRIQNGLTLEELASRTELTKGFLSQLERNLTSPSIITLADIVEALGSSMSDFFKEDTEENREKIKYLNSVNWSKIIERYYKNKVYIAEYNFCDYTDYQNKYISFFYFLDTEKINRTKYFLRENKNKNADIICNSELKQKIQKELPAARFLVVDLEDYIDKERNVYD